MITAAQTYNGPNRALFIIDGDLEWVRGAPAPAARNLHRHSAYCIENLLICKQAIIALLVQDIVLSDDDAEKFLKFSDWVKSLEAPLTNLFAAYAIAQELHPQLKTVSTGVGVMCTQRKKGKSSVLDPAKVEMNLQKLLAAVEETAGKENTQKRFKEIRKRIESLAFPLDAVSGKDFLLPLLMFQLQSFGSHISRRSIRVRLAGMCHEARLADLRNAVRKAALE